MTSKFRTMLAALGAALVVGHLSPVSAQATNRCLNPGDCPDFIPMRVTFYDFHSDRSNPEFEVPQHESGKGGGNNPGRRNMVRPQLDSDGKPMTNLPTVPDNRTSQSGAFMNHGVRFWFRDWGNLNGYSMASATNAANNSADTRYVGRPYLERFRPIYRFAQSPHFLDIRDTWISDEWNTAHEWRGNLYSDNAASIEDLPSFNRSADTAFKNRVVPAHLFFAHIGNGRYRFAPPQNTFFPLSDMNQNGRVDYDYGTGRYGPGLFQGGTTAPNRSYRAVQFWSDDDGNFVAANRRTAGCESPTYSAATCNVPFDPPFWRRGGDRNVGETPTNFSFTMELATDFEMENDLVFEFEGDDDIWLFINGRLVEQVDLGGFNVNARGSVNLNALRTSHGLVNGNRYSFQLFFAERHSDGSTIDITTNIFTPRVRGMKINVGGENLIAGESITADGFLEMPDGSRMHVNEMVLGDFTWSVTNADGSPRSPNDLTISNAARDSRKSNPNLTKTDSVSISATRAYTRLRIVGTFTDQYGAVVTDTAFVDVLPGPPAKLWIETSPDSAANLWAPARVGSITIPSGGRHVDNFHAVLRDRFGNWVSVAGTGGGWTGRSITWQSRNPLAAVLSVPTEPFGGGGGPTRGEGRARRGDQPANTVGLVEYRITGGTHAGRTFSETGGTTTGWTAANNTDSVLINVADITYHDIRLGVMIGGQFVAVDTVRMTVGGDTTLVVQMRRSDNDSLVLNAVATWEVAPIAFRNTLTTPPPSGNARTWAVRPTAPATAPPGTVTVRVPPDMATVGGVRLSASAVIIVEPRRDPQSMRFFTRRGTPVFTPIVTEHMPPANLDNGQARMYPVNQMDAVTVMAGQRLPVVAKLFHDAVPSAAAWLNEMAGPSGTAYSPGHWQWAFTNTSPRNANTTITASGDSLSFYSQVAHEVYIVEGTHVPTGMRRTIRIYVVPDSRPDNVLTPGDTSADGRRGVRLTLEPDPNPTGQHRNMPNRVDDPFTLFENQNETQFYAILRDRFGNFIIPSGARSNNFDPSYAEAITRFSRLTSWLSRTPANVSVAPGVAAIGEGIITREAGGDSWIIARDSVYNRTDSVLVRAIGFHLTEIVIAEPCQTGGVVVGAMRLCPVGEGGITMTTNDDRQVYVIGQTNQDGSSWILVSAEWGRDDGLADALPTPPQNQNNWVLSPRVTGDGTITAVVRGAGPGGSDLDASRPIRILNGPPIRAEIEVITPPERRIAGEPILIEVRYFNRNGLITAWDPSWSLEGAVFNDTTAGRGANIAPQWEPTIRSDLRNFFPTQPLPLYYLGHTYPLPVEWNANIRPSASGRDTVEIILYNAAETHQIHYLDNVAGAGGARLTALSDRFTILPGPPAEVEIIVDGKVPSCENNDPEVDCYEFDFNESERVFRTRTRDRFGNEIGEHPGDWDTRAQDGGEPADGPPHVNARNRSRVVYSPGSATGNGTVRICVDLVDDVTGLPLPNVAEDCIDAVIRGVTVRVLTAVTRDLDGCGFLDAVDIRFARPVRLTTAFADGASPDTLAQLRHSVGGTAYAIISSGRVLGVGTPEMIEDETGTRHPHFREFRIPLGELHGTPLQTGWTPELRLGDSLFADVARQTITAVDGAPPVIDRALIFFGREGNIYVDISFSEDIHTSNGIPFADDALTGRFVPNELFNIWRTAGSGDDHSSRMMDFSRDSGRRAQNRTRPLGRMAAHDPVPELVRVPGFLGAINQPVREADRESARTLRFDLPADGSIEIDPSRHFVNIRTDAHRAGTDDTVHVQDRRPAPNSPLENNRRVRFGYGNEPDSRPSAIPNPARPDGGVAGHPPGAVNPGNADDRLVQDVISGNTGGTIVRLPVFVPRSGTMHVSVKVYDLAGNLVNSGEEQNANDEQFWSTRGGLMDMNIYWNGFNAQGMRVAPGTYRVVLEVRYSGQASDEASASRNRKVQTLVGITQ